MELKSLFDTHPSDSAVLCHICLQLHFSGVLRELCFCVLFYLFSPGLRTDQLAWYSMVLALVDVAFQRFLFFSLGELECIMMNI